MCIKVGNIAWLIVNESLLYFYHFIARINYYKAPFYFFLI